MPKDAGKLFIGGLNWESSQDTLRGYFAAYGPISDVVIMRDKATGRSRGFGFLTFENPSHIDAVLKGSHAIDGRTVEVKRAVPKENSDAQEPQSHNNNYPNNNSNNTHDNFNNNFNNSHYPNNSSTSQTPNNFNGNFNNNFDGFNNNFNSNYNGNFNNNFNGNFNNNFDDGFNGFNNFPNNNFPNNNFNYNNNFQNNNFNNFNGNTYSSNYGNENNNNRNSKGSDNQQIRTKKIFVGGIPHSSTEAALRGYFAQLGTVVDAQVMTDRETGRSRGFGFVSFDSEDTVDKIMSQPHEIDGKQVEIKRAEPKRSFQPGATRDKAKSSGDNYNTHNSSNDFRREADRGDDYRNQRGNMGRHPGILQSINTVSSDFS